MAKIHELYNKYIESNKKNTEFIAYLENPQNAEQINSQDHPDKSSVLHMAVLNGDLNTVNLLLIRQAKADLRDRHGKKPVRYALKGPDVNQSIFDEFVKFKQASDIDVNEKDEFGYTALHSAVYMGIIKKIQNLLNLGADINSKYDANFSPIEMAITIGLVNEEEVLRVLFNKNNIVNLHTPIFDITRKSWDFPSIPHLTDGVIVIGSTHIDPVDNEKKPVNRLLPAYRSAITNVKEFEEAIKAGAKFNYTQLEKETKRLIDNEQSTDELLRFYTHIKKYKELYDSANTLLSKVKERPSNIAKENLEQNSATVYEKKHLLLQQATEIYNTLTEAGEVRAPQLLHDIYLTTAIIDAEEGNIDAFLDLYMVYFQQHPANEISLRFAELIAGRDFPSSALLNNQNKWQLILFLLNGVDSADAERLRANALAILKQASIAAVVPPHANPLSGQNVEKTPGIAGDTSYKEIAGVDQIISFADAKAVTVKLQQEPGKPDDVLIKIKNGGKIVIAEQLVLSPNNIQALKLTDGKLLLDESLPSRFEYLQEVLFMKFYADFICEQLQGLITVPVNPQIKLENSNGKDEKESKKSKKIKKERHKSIESTEGKEIKKDKKSKKDKKIKKERHGDKESITTKETNVSSGSCGNKEADALKDKLKELLTKALEIASVARQGIAASYISDVPKSAQTADANNATAVSNVTIVGNASMVATANNAANTDDTSKANNAKRVVTENSASSIGDTSKANNTTMVITGNNPANANDTSKASNATTASKYMKQLQEINEITQSCSQVFICLTDYQTNPKEPHKQETLQQACKQLEELVNPKAPTTQWPKGAPSKSSFFTPQQKPPSTSSALPIDLNLLHKLSQEWLIAAQALRASLSQTPRLT